MLYITIYSENFLNVIVYTTGPKFEGNFHLNIIIIPPVYSVDTYFTTEAGFYFVVRLRY